MHAVHSFRAHTAGDTCAVITQYVSSTARIFVHDTDTVYLRHTWGGLADFGSLWRPLAAYGGLRRPWPWPWPWLLLIILCRSARGLESADARAREEGRDEGREDAQVRAHFGDTNEMAAAAAALAPLAALAFRRGVTGRK